jgi:hypothetical protein
MGTEIILSPGAVKDSRTRFAAFGVGVKSGAG